MDLKGKTAIVTGAGRGIGRELAREFARSGANTICAARSTDKLSQTVDMIAEEGGTGLAVATDVTDWVSVSNMVNKAIREFGRIDLLFNNAGSFRSVGPVWEADPQTWWEDVIVNLRGSMLCCRAVLPRMIDKNSGVIINMDGGGGSEGPNIGGSAYGCSKAAVLRFSQSLAGELKREGHSIFVFCINPGFVHTDMTEYLISSPELAKWQPHVVDLVGSDREMPPQACAKATMQLLEIAGPELSGRIFYVDSDFSEIAARKE